MSSGKGQRKKTPKAQPEKSGCSPNASQIKKEAARRTSERNETWEQTLLLLLKKNAMIPCESVSFRSFVVHSSDSHLSILILFATAQNGTVAFFSCGIKMRQLAVANCPASCDYRGKNSGCQDEIFRSNFQDEIFRSDFHL